MAKTLRELIDVRFTTKGSELTSAEIDQNFIEIEDDIDSINTAIAGLSTHTQGTDATLDAGGANEVSAAEIRNTVDNALENVSEDTTPELGGNLYVKNFDLQFTDDNADDKGVIEADTNFGLVVYGIDANSYDSPVTLHGSRTAISGTNIYHRSNSVVENGVLKYGIPITVNGETLYPIIAVPEGGIVHQESFTDTNNYGLSGGGEVTILTSSALSFNYQQDKSYFEYAFAVTEAASNRVTRIEYWVEIDDVQAGTKQSEVVDGAFNGGRLDISGGATIGQDITAGSVVKLVVQALDTGQGRTTTVIGATQTTQVILTETAGTVQRLDGAAGVNAVNDEDLSGKAGKAVIVNDTEDGFELGDVAGNDFGGFFQNDNADATNCSTDTWVDLDCILGNMSLAPANFSAADNVITYEGTETLKFAIHWDISASKSGGGSDEYQFRINKNGSPLNGVVSRTFAAGDTGAMGMHQVVELSENDTLELQVNNKGSNDDITVTDQTIIVTQI